MAKIDAEVKNLRKRVRNLKKGDKLIIEVMALLLLGIMFIMDGLSAFVWGKVVWVNYISMLLALVIGMFLIDYALKIKEGKKIETRVLKNLGILLILYGLNQTYIIIDILFIAATGQTPVGRIITTLIVFAAGVFILRRKQKRIDEGVTAA